jgi:CHAD domain-containing protein
LETEAKFIVPDKARFARLRGVKQFGSYEKQQETVKTVHDRYVDTPDHRFYNSQLYVRLREGKDGDLLLTVKRLGAPPDGAVHARDEYQVQVPSMERTAWPESPVTSMVNEIAGDQHLVDLVGVDQTRLVSNLVQGERAVAELSLDQVTIQTAHKPVTAYELEAELLPDGNESDLSDLVRVFMEEYNLAPQPLTKFERAMRMAEDGKGQNGKAGTAKARRAQSTVAHTSGYSADDSVTEPLLESGLPGSTTLVKGMGDADTPAAQSETGPKQEAKPQEDKGEKRKSEMGLEHTDSIDVASRKIVSFYFEAMLDNEKGTLEGEDPEAVHDMRVATRRMRAALRVLGPYLRESDPTKLRSGLRAIAQALGAVRDMDVLIENAKKFRDNLPEEQQADMDGLLGEWKDERDGSRKRLVRLLESKDYDRFKKRLNSFIKEQEKLHDPDPATLTDLEPYQVRHVAPTAILTNYEIVRSFEAIMDAAAQMRKNESGEGSRIPLSELRLDELPPTIEQLHALRINGKYLRYTLECFRETLPPDASTLIRDVTKMQDQLGELHDADVAAGLVKDHVGEAKKRRKKSDPEYTAPPGLLAYLEERESAIRRIYADFLSTWSKIEGHAWRARLAAVILA